MVYNILVIHNLGPHNNQRNCLSKLVFFLKDYNPCHNYVYHDVSLPFPNWIKSTRFDVIILDVTFLSLRWAPRKKFEKIKSKYSFVADSKALKIAFPQDEYDCSNLLDQWMCIWKIDIVYSVLSSNLNLIYPKFYKFGTIKLAYTGYIDDNLLNYPVKNFQERNIDIGYRARKNLPYFGYIGDTKWKIADVISQKLLNTNLKYDISYLDSDQFIGDDWYDFINDCKFSLGSNSGSSIIDPDGSLRKRVSSYLKKHPHYNFQNVREECYPKDSEQNEFTAISPRNIETALLESAQILVDGEYSKILAPWEHYIPLRSDGANFDEVINAMRETGDVIARIKRCKEAILECKDLRFSSIAENLFDTIKENYDDISSEKQQNISIRRKLENYNVKSNNTINFVYKMKNYREITKKIPLLGIFFKLLFSSFFLRLIIHFFRILGLPYSKY